MQLSTVMVLEHTSILKLQNSWTGKETTKRAIIQRWFTTSVSLSILRRLWPDWKHTHIYIAERISKRSQMFFQCLTGPQAFSVKAIPISASISKSLYWGRLQPTSKALTLQIYFCANMSSLHYNGSILRSWMTDGFQSWVPFSLPSLQHWNSSGPLTGLKSQWIQT